MKFNNKYTETFNSVQRIPDLLEYAVNKYGENAAVKIKNGTKIEHISYNQMKYDICSMCSYISQKSLINCNIAIIGSLSYEWIITFLAITSSGNIAVTVDKDLCEDDTKKLLDQVNISGIFFNDEFHQKSAYLNNEFDQLPINKDFTDVREMIKNNFQEGSCICTNINPDDVAMLVFTSGTTGSNKAVALTHRSICDNVCCCVHFLEDAFSPQQHILPVLPPHHMFEITAGILTPLYYGVSVCFGGSLKYISNSLKIFKPVVLILVPMIVEGLYKKIQLELSKRNKIKKFNAAVILSNFLLKFHIDIRKTLFKDIHETLGGNLQIIVCGGAYLEPDLVQKFEDIGISLRNGYGITECSPVVACNMAKKQRIGSVGIIAPSPYCEVKIDNDEILIRGSIVMKEYYKDPKATDMAFHDGWFRTGDLGYVDNDGFLFITGRRKNLIILSDGNNISPEELELPLKKLNIINSVFVCGKKHNGNTVITALIYPDYEYVQKANINDISLELETEVSKLNENLPPHKRIQKIELCEEGFSKTALGKIKRYMYV